MAESSLYADSAKILTVLSGNTTSKIIDSILYSSWLWSFRMNKEFVFLTHKKKWIRNLYFWNYVKQYQSNNTIRWSIGLMELWVPVGIWSVYWGLVNQFIFHFFTQAILSGWTSFRIADAEENLGESEVREAHLAKSLFFIRVGDKVHKYHILLLLKVLSAYSGA